MQTPPLTPDEPTRLAALRATGLLDTPLEDRFEALTRLAQRLFDVPIAAISLIDADRQWFKSIQGLDAQETSRDVSFCGHTILNSEVMVIPDARKDPRFADNPLVTGSPHIVFYAGGPIRSRCGSHIASVCLIDTKPRQMTEEDKASLRDLAAMAQVQFEHSAHQSVAHELIGQLEVEKRNALIDPLTRLWNRDGIDNLFGQQIHECVEAGMGVAVILADIDRFKRINDNYGHPVGDQVLREFGRRLLAGARTCDHVGRYGGEEFIIVLGGCDSLDAAHDIAECLRKRVNEHPIQAEAEGINVTCSFGVCYMGPGDVVTPEDMICKADEALYRAKAEGRDRVSCHGPASSAA